MKNERTAWQMVRSPGQLDEREFFDALLKLPQDGEFDHRSRMLAHDALDVFAGRWGEAEVRRRLGQSSDGLRLWGAWADEYDKVGFPFIGGQLVEVTKPEEVLTMLRELGKRLRRPASILIGGSISLILTKVLERETHDVDVVNELPEAIRTEYALVDELARRYKLRMTHFASHYLPDGYERRARSIGAFNQLDARLVDPIDVLTGKLFSKRPKDLDDIRAALPKIDLDSLRDRVRTTTGGLRGERDYLERGTQNWYILTGDEELPS